jgi:cytidine deaminase
MSYGQNHYSNNPNMPSIHAEHDAINKLPYSRKKQEINMLVIRFSDKKLSMSKPCKKCINMMINLFPKKGYIIKKIYYSDQNGEITKTKLDKLI